MIETIARLNASGCATKLLRPAANKYIETVVILKPFRWGAADVALAHKPGESAALIGLRFAHCVAGLGGGHAAVGEDESSHTRGRAWLQSRGEALLLEFRISSLVPCGDYLNCSGKQGEVVTIAPESFSNAKAQRRGERSGNHNQSARTPVRALLCSLNARTRRSPPRESSQHVAVFGIALREKKSLATLRLASWR